MALRENHEIAGSAGMILALPEIVWVTFYEVSCVDNYLLMEVTTYTGKRLLNGKNLHKIHT